MNPEKIPEYQKGGEGMVQFVEDNVCLQIQPRGSNFPKWCPVGDLPDKPDSVTGRSYREFWKMQKDVLQEALVMKRGEFKYRLIVFCWPRGEGKSVDVCLVQLWKFLCFPRQLIVLGANSKDQVRFVHYDIMRDIIMHSPKLLRAIGSRNVQEKQISLRDKHGNVQSSIRAISSFSGIVSNISGYTFSEIFDMSNPKFFVQLDGSIRNIPNALGTIDSTVSDKDHILYSLYKTYRAGLDKTLFFHHRSSPELDYRDFWHPLNDQQQLNSFQAKYPAADVDRYFRNSWEMTGGKLFPPNVVESVYQIGVDGEVGHQAELLEINSEIHKIRAKQEEGDKRKHKVGRIRTRNAPGRKKKKRELTPEERIDKMESRIIPVSDLYRMEQVDVGKTVMAPISALSKLSEVFNTDWCILAGIDRSDPLAKEGEARTIVTITAKGLPDSKGAAKLRREDDEVPNFIYFLLLVGYVEDASLEGIKDILVKGYNEYDGIDTLCAERWGTWDLKPWCEHMEIHFEATFPSYEKQKQIFNELWIVSRFGRFKTPSVFIPGSIEEDILHEEMVTFDYNPKKKWYGSPHKFDKNGVQDDVIYSLGWCLFGGRELTVYDMRERRQLVNFGTFFGNRSLHGDYRQIGRTV